MLHRKAEIPSLTQIIFVCTMICFIMPELKTSDQILSEINHKFMEPGESYMEADAIHALIERGKKKATVATEVIRESCNFRKSVRRISPQGVVEMEQKEFLQFSSLVSDKLVHHKKNKEEMEHPHIFNMPDLDTKIDERGIGYVFFHKMKENKDKIMQIDGITGEEDTYKSFLQRCIRTAITMREKGIKAKDIVSICSENHLDVVVPYFAAIFLGARSVCFNPYSSPQTNLFLMEQTNVVPKILFVSINSLDFAKAVLEKQSCEIVVFGSATEYTPFEEFLVPSGVENDFQPYEADSSKNIAIMHFSSGSSGLPKLICLNHCAFLGQVIIHINCHNYYDRMIIFSTLNWITSVLYCAVTVMLGGLRIILAEFDGNKLFNLVNLYKPTLLLIGRYNSLLINPLTKKNVDISSVKLVGIIGSGLTKEQLIWLRSIFPTTKIYIFYGCTEAGLIAFPRTETTKELEFFKTKLMSCGTPLVGHSYKVVNPETEEILGPNEIGELRLKSKYTASCYYNMDSSDMYDERGWLKTGDLVYYDTDGYFYVVDRLKDVIIVRSKPVYPVFIENILLSHPSVKDAVVVAKLDLVNGDLPMAVVVVHEKGTVTEDELIKFVDEKVEDIMRLAGGVILVDSIQLTSTGKVSRYLTKKYVRELENKKLLVNNT